MFKYFCKKKDVVDHEINIYKLSDINFNVIPNIQQLKNSIDIAVIDDQEFTQAKLLESNNFRLKEVGDIKSIKSIEAYPIIICDIHGVGASFDNSGLGGAFLISEIRKNYPDKYIIAYSTHSNDLALQRHTKNADYVMPVPSAIEHWTEALEQAIKNVGDPVLRWKRFRYYLLENNIELSEVYKLEQAYIRYYLTPSQNIDNIVESASELAIANDFKDVIKQFVTAAVVEVGKTLMLGS